VSLLAAILLARLSIPAHETTQHEPSTARRLGLIARHPGFFPAVLMSSVCFSLMTLYITVTPLGMQEQGFNMTDITMVIQSQVLSMFIPAFFTGILINRLGLLPVLWAGVGFICLAMLIGAASSTLPVYMASRIALGVGWNFMFIGSAVLLSHTHTPAERGKVQGVNDLTMFTLVTVISITAGALLQQLGWHMLHLASLAPVTLVAAALLRLRANRLKPGADPAGRND